MKKILFLTDLFRIVGSNEFQLDPFLWSIFQLFSEQIRISTGQVPEVNFSRDKHLFDVKRFYELCNYEYNEEGWLKISSYDISSESEQYFINTFKDYLLITYHANPLMIRLFKKYHMPYIDMFEGSVRFLEDLHLCMRSNIECIYRKLLRYQYLENFIFIEAGRVRSYYKYNGLNPEIKENSLLLIGQTESDISLLVDKKYITLSDCKDALHDTISNYDHVYYKAHPYVRNDSGNRRLLSELTSYEVCTINYYKLVSLPQIAGVAALSSGCLKEAKYFRKNVHTLSHLYCDYHVDESVIDIDKFVIMTTDYYSPTFWADILAPILETKEVEYFNFGNRADVLRGYVFGWWGYEMGLADNPIVKNLQRKSNHLEKRCTQLEAVLCPNNANDMSNKIKFDQRIKNVVKKCLRPFPRIDRKVRQVYKFLTDAQQ